MKHFHRHCRKKYNPDQVQTVILKEIISLDELNFLEIHSNLNNSSIKNNKHSDYRENQIQYLLSTIYVCQRSQGFNDKEKRYCYFYHSIYTLIPSKGLKWIHSLKFNFIYLQLLKERRIVSNKKYLTRKSFQHIIIRISL